jgi:predicted adenylyl cyclase CyaB
MNTKEMYTTYEAAEYLDIHYQTVRSYIKKGLIKAVKIGRTLRIPYLEVEKLRPDQKKQELEIELRFKLKNKTKTENLLRKLGAKLTNHSHVIDYYYCDININTPDENALAFNSPVGYGVRIREMDNDYSGKVNTTLEIKKLAGPDFTDHSNCLEAEIEVKDKNSTHILLTMMNLKQFIVIDKERFVYRLGDLKYCFDSIKGWGDGLEIEKIATEDFHLVLKNLMEKAKQLGLSKKDMPENSFTFEAIKTLARFH